MLSHFSVEGDCEGRNSFPALSEYFVEISDELGVIGLDEGLSACYSFENVF